MPYMPMNMNNIETKEDADAREEKVQRTFRSISNTMNINHNEMIDWQMKFSIIALIISAIIIISLVTSIILTNIYVSQINRNINEITNQINELNTTMIGLKNDIYESETIKSNNEEIDNDVNLPEETPSIVEEPIVYNYTQIDQKSGFTAGQFNEIINTTLTKMNKNTSVLYDIGSGLYSAEQEYNINGLYLLGIASLESGWGKSKMATSNNNIYGLVGLNFDSINDCSEYMGKLIRNSYIDKGYSDLSKIQSKYCPNGGTKWVTDIQWCTNKYVTTAKDLYPQ